MEIVSYCPDGSGLGTQELWCQLAPDYWVAVQSLVTISNTLSVSGGPHLIFEDLSMFREDDWDI